MKATIIKVERNYKEDKTFDLIVTLRISYENFSYGLNTLYDCEITQ